MATLGRLARSFSQGRILTMDITMLRRALWVFLRPLMQLISNLVNPEIGDEWLREFHKFLRKEPCWVEKANAYLRPLFEGELLSVESTDGTDTLELLAEMFPGGIYGADVVVSAVSSPLATLTRVIKMYEQIEDGKFKPIFESLGKNRQKFQSLFQVGAFCRDHRDKLRKGRYGYGTFFELEGGVVARVSFGDRGRLLVRVFPLDYGRVWYVEDQHRFVFPQLAA